MSKLIIFGERPGPNTDPARPLYPHTPTGAAARLIDLLGMTTEEYLDETKVVRYNVWDERQPEPHWMINHARARVWQRMLRHMELDGLPNFLFLGRAAANAGPKLVRQLAWGIEKEDAMVIPHPSGRNRYYNSQANTSYIRQSLRDFLGRS